MIITKVGNLPGAHPYPQDLLVGQKDGQKQPSNQKPSIVSAPAAHAGSSLLGSLSSNQKPSAEIPKLTPKTTPTPKSIPKLSPHQPTLKSGLVPPNLTGVGLEDKNDDRSITELLSKSNSSANLTSSGVTSSTSTVQGQINSNLNQTKKTPDGKKNEFKHFKKRIQSEFNKTPLLNEIIKVKKTTSGELPAGNFRIDKLFYRLFRDHRRRTNPYYPHPSLQPKVNMLLNCQRLRLLLRQLLLQQLRH